MVKSQICYIFLEGEELSSGKDNIDGETYASNKGNNT